MVAWLELLLASTALLSLAVALIAMPVPLFWAVTVVLLLLLMAPMALPLLSDWTLSATPLAVMACRAVPLVVQVKSPPSPVSVVAFTPPAPFVPAAATAGVPEVLL